MCSVCVCVASAHYTTVKQLNYEFAALACLVLGHHKVPVMVCHSSVNGVQHVLVLRICGDVDGQPL